MYGTTGQVKILQKQVVEACKTAYSQHFNKNEVQALLSIFHDIKGKNDKLDRSQFRDLLTEDFNMTDDLILDRMFRAFDVRNDSYITPDEWISGLSVWLRGSLEEKMKYTFNVYDLNGDGYISREEMFQLLKSSLVKQPSEEDPDEGVKDLVETALKKMDYDHDSRVSFSDFKQAVEAENLLLEAFGTCLPACPQIEAYEAKIRKKMLEKN